MMPHILLAIVCLAIAVYVWLAGSTFIFLLDCVKDLRHRLIDCETRLNEAEAVIDKHERLHGADTGTLLQADSRLKSVETQLDKIAATFRTLSEGAD